MQLEAGTLIAGRYRLERRLGAGGMGEVWEAKNVSVGTDVAVKFLLPAAQTNAELVVRFRREALLLARLRNDHVARVLDFATDEAQGPVLVMDLVRGEPVSAVLERERLDVDDAVDLAIDVLRGLVDLHRANVVHRDIKPGNVILEERFDGSRKAVIVDFGLGRLMANDDEGVTAQVGITQADVAVGTMEYMAPEQILNSSGVTGAADLYALGALLFRAVAGHHLFGDATSTELARAKLMQESPPLTTGRDDPLATRFEAIVNRATQRARSERYAKAEEMLDDLIKLRADVPRARIDEDAPTLLFSNASFASLRASLERSSPDAEARSRETVKPPKPVTVPPRESAPPSAASPAPAQGARTFLVALVALVFGIVVGAGLRGLSLGNEKAPPSSSSASSP